MSTPWIVVIVAQWVLLTVLAMVQLGILTRVLPLLERAARDARPRPVRPPAMSGPPREESRA